MSKKKGFSMLFELPAVQQYFELKDVDRIKFVREKQGHSVKQSSI
jgi:hypothetical protein